MSVEEKAKVHWEYSKGIIDLSLKGSYVLNNVPHISIEEAEKLMEYFYTQAFIHGYKHGKEEQK